MERLGQLKQRGGQQSKHSIYLGGGKIPEGQEDSAHFFILLCFALFLSRANSLIKFSS